MNAALSSYTVIKLDVNMEVQFARSTVTQDSLENRDRVFIRDKCLTVVAKPPHTTAAASRDSEGRPKMRVP